MFSKGALLIYIRNAEVLNDSKDGCFLNKMHTKLTQTDRLPILNVSSHSIARGLMLLPGLVYVRCLVVA